VVPLAVLTLAVLTQYQLGTPAARRRFRGRWPFNAGPVTDVLMNTKQAATQISWIGAMGHWDLVPVTLIAHFRSLLRRTSRR